MVLKTKLNPDGALDRLKAHLVAEGFHLVPRTHFSETFPQVVKPGSIRTILSVAMVQKWSIRQLDVKSAPFYMDTFTNQLL